MIEQIISDGQSVFVSDSAALADAYQVLSTSGGGTIYLSPGVDPIELVFKVGGSDPVRVVSADPLQPVELTRIWMTDVDNVSVSDVTVDSSGVDRPDWYQDLSISRSSNIDITGVAFQSNGSGFYDPADPDAVLGERMGSIRESSDITFSGNSVTSYFHGLRVVDSRTIDIFDNTFTDLQGDGLRMGGVQGVEIRGNTFHDFAGSVNSFNHSDMIQIWSTDPLKPSSDIIIADNVFDSGDGVATQTIWIRNEQYDKGIEGALPHSNITITNNLIYNGHVHGIAAGSTEGLVISENTLLWNSDAKKYVTADDGRNYEPFIRVYLSNDILITNNIAPRINVEDTATNVTQSGNHILSYTSPEDPGYVGTHFLNHPDGANGDVILTSLKSDSPFVGAGSSFTAPVEAQEGAAESSQDLVVDPTTEEAPGSSPMDGVDPPAEPDVPDQTGAEAPTDGPSEELPVVPALPAGETLLSIDFDSGFDDASNYDSALRFGNKKNLMEDGDGQAYRIGGRDRLEVLRGNEQIHSLDKFALSLEIQLLGDGETGRFLNLHQVMEARIENDRSISFKLTTDQGTAKLRSKDVTFDDGAPHTFAVAYDSEVGQVVMLIDGEVLDTAALTGVTAPERYHGLTLGETWGRSPEALIDDVFLGTDPADVGLEMSPGLFESLLYDSGTVFELDTLSGEALAAVSFENRFDDLSGYDSVLRHGEQENVVEGLDGHAYRIGGRDRFEIARDNDQIHSLDKFALSLEIQLLEDDTTGRFLHFHKVMEARIEDDRSISFSLTTDQGTVTLNSGETTFDDGDPHAFAVAYDSEAGRVAMSIDGQVLDSAALTGVTAPERYHGLTLGETWGDAPTALVDNFFLGTDPADVDIDLSESVYYALLANAVEIQEPDIGEDTQIVDDTVADDAGFAA